MEGVQKNISRKRCDRTVQCVHKGLYKKIFLHIQRDNNAAIVVCRMLGLSGGEVVVDNQLDRFGTTEIRHLQMTNVKCTGEENSIFDCPMKVDVKDEEEGCGINAGAYLGIVCS